MGKYGIWLQQSDAMMTFKIYAKKSVASKGVCLTIQSSSKNAKESEQKAIKETGISGRQTIKAIETV